jgi:hypothetical protein
VNNARVYNPSPLAPIDYKKPHLEPGKFPIHALSLAMRAMAENVADVHRVPVELPAMCAIGIVSGALGNAFTLCGAVNGKNCYGNLYVIPAAPKSSGKGSVAGPLVRPLLEASAALENDFRQRELPRLRAEKSILEKRVNLLVNDLATGKCRSGKDRHVMGEAEKAKTRRELEEAQQCLEAIVPKLDALPTYWVANATSEAMAAQFKQSNSNLFCYSPEAGEVVRVLMGKYRNDGKADYDLALSGYSVEPWRSDRKGSGVCQITPCLSMLLLVQPCILRELMADEEAFERGLTARTLPFIVMTEPIEDDGIARRINEQTDAAWNQLICSILARRETLIGHPHRIVCAPDAREVFRQFHNESVRLRRGEFRDVEAELGRWRENAIRLAVVQAIADNVDTCELTAEQASRAVEIMRWCAVSALQITKTARMLKRANRADDLQAILEGRCGSETLRNLDKNHGFPKQEVETLAAQFKNRFTVEQIKTGGRPSDILRLS